MTLSLLINAELIRRSNLIINELNQLVKAIKKDLPYLNMTGLLNVWSERQDLNLRPLHPQCSALPDCATPRWTNYFTHY